MTIVIVNERFSPNLGDGLIALSMDHAFARAAPTLQLRGLDIDFKVSHLAMSQHPLAGIRRGLRESVGRVSARTLETLMDLRSRHLTMPRILTRAREALTGASMVLFGGGHLFNGSAAYFAERLAAFVRAARETSVPLAVYAVGVSNPDTWGKHTAKLFREAFAGSDGFAYVSTRDSMSSRYWAKAFGGMPPPVDRDPGLLAAEVFAPDVARGRQARGGQRPRIGIGVMSGSEAALHAAALGDFTEARAELFCELALAVTLSKATPVLFTNGSPADEEVLTAVQRLAVARAPGSMSGVESCRAPKTPADLVANIASLDAVIAHRLHANIIAYSLRIPHVGLGWDEKVASFFQSVGRSRCFFHEKRPSAEVLVERLYEAISDPTTDEDHQRVLGEARAGLDAVITCLALASSRSIELGRSP